MRAAIVSLLLLVLGLFDSASPSMRTVYSVGAGLCAGFMVLDGHLGWLPDYAVPYLAFLAPQWRQVQRVWRWLALSVAVLAVTAASHVYDVALESSNALTGRNNQETVGMNVWRLIFYPISPPHGASNATRAIAIGGPFFLLAAIGLVYPLRHRYASSLRAGVVVSFLFWFVPLHWSSILSTNYAAAAPFTIFAVFLAGLTLQALWQRFARWRWVLLGAVGFVLLIACANVANLLLSRGVATKFRTSLQLAIGASRGRIIRAKLTESVILAVLGGLAGLLLAYYASRAMVLLAFRGADYVPISAAPSWPVLGVTFLIALVTGMVFGVAPAWVASKSNPADTLRGAARTTRDAAGAGQKILVVLQAALSLALLTMAGLVTFPEIGHALAVPGGYLAVNLLQANFISPAVLGHRLTLNPVAILVGLVFWWWIWGVGGAFIAVPLLATFKIFCDHIESLAPIGEFLGK